MEFVQRDAADHHRPSVLRRSQLAVSHTKINAKMGHAARCRDRVDMRCCYLRMFNSKNPLLLV